MNYPIKNNLRPVIRGMAIASSGKAFEGKAIL